MYTRQIFLGVILTLVMWEGGKATIRLWANKATQEGGAVGSSVGEATKLVIGK